MDLTFGERHRALGDRQAVADRMGLVDDPGRSGSGAYLAPEGPVEVEHLAAASFLQALTQHARIVRREVAAVCGAVTPGPALDRAGLV
jgi:hypothetical protein